MTKTEAFETICPHCRCKTLVPAMMTDYQWKSERYYSNKKRFYCIYCQGSIEVKAHRGILDIERC